MKSTLSTVYISIGSNVNAFENITTCINLLKEKFCILDQSSLYKTKPMKNSKFINFFLNKVIKINTKLSKKKIDDILKSIEQKMERKTGSNEIPIDVDIIMIKNEKVIFEEPEIYQYSYLYKLLIELNADVEKNRCTKGEILKIEESNSN